MLVSPPANRSLSSSWTFVDSASAGRKLAVSSRVTSASFAPSGASAPTATIQRTMTSHLVRRPETKWARAAIGRKLSLGGDEPHADPPRVGGDVRAEPAANGRERVGVERDRPLAQPDGSFRRRPDALAAPRVQADVVVVAAGRDEDRTRVGRHRLEPEHVAVEVARGVDVAHV